MLFEYNKIIKFSKNKKIDSINLELENKEPKLCCKGIKSLIELGIIQIDTVSQDEKSKIMIIGFKINHEGKPKTIRANNCPNCGEKIETKLLNTLEYDKRT